MTYDELVAKALEHLGDRPHTSYEVEQYLREASFREAADELAMRMLAEILAGRLMAERE